MFIWDIIKDFTSGRFFIESNYKSIIPEYHNTESTNYIVLEKIFCTFIKLKEDDIVVDVGCGTGRVIDWLLKNTKLKKIIGYEVNKSIAVKLKQKYSKFDEIEIFDIDIFDLFPDYATIFYLYNPFPLTSVNIFINKLIHYNKNLIIIYYNPVFLKAFEDNKQFTIKEYEIRGGLPWVAIITMNSN